MLFLNFPEQRLQIANFVKQTVLKQILIFKKLEPTFLLKKMAETIN